MNKIDYKKFNFEDYPLHSFDKIRFNDTDRQGHVNNTVFVSYLGTGRVEFLYDPKAPIVRPGSAFVVASLKIDLISEMHWPGKIDIGTAVLHIGNSSFKLVQGLYQDGVLAAAAESVIVQIDKTTRLSKPLSNEAKEILNKNHINNILK